LVQVVQAIRQIRDQIGAAIVMRNLVCTSAKIPQSFVMQASRNIAMDGQREGWFSLAPAAPIRT
jgi:hypothetical protein